jgi:hypothetical protein
MTTSSLTLPIIKPAGAQTPMPTSSAAPITSQYIAFTLKLVYSSYNETTPNPYTGANVTQQIINNTVEVSIKNQPWIYNGIKYDLWYNIRTKGHFETDNWASLYSNPDPSIGSSIIPPSNSGYSVVSYPLENYPPNAQVDFSVQAFAWNFSTGYYPDGRYFSLAILVGKSDWSNTQTITIPASSASASASPTPAIPEFPTLIILPLFAVMILLSIVFVRKKIPRNSQLRKS